MLRAHAAAGGLRGTGALLKVGHRCDQRCVFCHASAGRGVEAPAERIHALVERAAGLGHRRVVFSGGEPTLRPELLAWAEHATRLGLGFGLVSNGLRLGDRAFARTLCAEGLEYAHLSLHGPREVHARAARVDSYDAIRCAIDELAGRIPRLVVNCVVTRQNLPHLRALVRALARALGSASGVVLKLSLVEPKGDALARFDEIVPEVGDAADAVVGAIDEGLAVAGAGLAFAHDGVPLCRVGRHAELRSDLRSEGLTMMAEAHEHDLHPVDDRNRVHPPLCRACALRGRCPGLYRATLEAQGSGAIGPAQPGPLGNSFHYVLGRWHAAVGTGCPVAAVGTAPWDRGRDLWIRYGGRVGLYHAGTRDFTDREIERVKIATGQIYFDAAPHAAPSDFRRELVPLGRAACCALCAEDSACTGLYEPRFDDRFAPFEGRLRALLSTLSGDLLDVGAGEARYVDAIAPAAARGQARYLAVDPSADAMAALRARYPWAEVRVAAEAELAAGERFDHVLLLGSWNHLPDLASTAARVVGRLRPGGSLVVSDDVPFGLARSPARAASAEQSRALREHRRLDGLAEARERLEALGLEVLLALAVSPESATRWLLHLRKPGPRLPP